MRVRDLAPLVFIGGIIVFIVVQRRSLPQRPAPPPRPSASQDDAAPPPAAPPVVVVTQEAAVAAAPPRDDADIRIKLQDGAPGTYIREILAQQAQMLVRWPERRTSALRVWIERSSAVPNWDSSYPIVAERAFHEWREAGFPLEFDIVPDSTGTDLQIQWSKAFQQGTRQIGVTNLTRDQYGWIVRATIVVATFDPSGRPLPPSLIAGVARHEVGHALGLGHSPNTTDVMYPESTSEVISRVDRATLHLLYMLPPGVVK